MGVLREAKQAASEGASAPISARPTLAPVDPLVDSYRRLADVFHEVLAEQRLNELLDRIADALGELVPYDAFTIYQADEARRCLIPTPGARRLSGHPMLSVSNGRSISHARRSSSPRRVMYRC